MKRWLQRYQQKLSPLRVRVLVGALWLVLVLLGSLSFDFLQQSDRWIYDGQLKSSSHRESGFDANVVIVDIDEKSLTQIGRWPWSRTQIATLIEAIAKQSPSVIGTDIVFAEPQADDKVLRDSLAKIRTKTPVVLGYYFSNDSGAPSTGVTPAPLFALVNAKEHTATQWSRYVGNVELLKEFPAGFFNPLIDADGVVRQLPLLAATKEGLYESLALAVIRQHMLRANSSNALANDTSSVPDILREDSLVLGAAKLSIPLSASYTALVPFESKSGPNQRFRYVSASDLLANSVDLKTFENKIVLVGTSAIGIADLRATPVNQVMPGVETHATLIAGALNQTIKQQPVDAAVMLQCVLALLGACVVIAMARSGPRSVLIIGAAAIAVWYMGAQWTLHTANWWIPSAAFYYFSAGLVVLNLVIGYFTEGRSRKVIESLFGEYVPAHLVAHMSRDPERFMDLRSENKELTILFADVRGFTRIAETMAPEDLRAYMNEYLTTMTEIIHRHGGTVDKYIGDAVMAFWGAPLPDENHATHAVQAGLEMISAAESIGKTFVKRGWPAVAIGVGINTGNVCVGDMGSSYRRSYTVLGDAVNLAARFENLTKHFTVPLIFGARTQELMKSDTLLEVSPLGHTAVQGRAQEVKVFTSAQFVSAPIAVRTLNTQL